MANEVVVSLIILTGLGLLFAAILAVAYKKLKVEEDPRIDKVESMLPNANCGACGVPGCRAFAEKVVNNELSPSKCTVSSSDGISNIATYLGVSASQEEKRYARLLCAGGAKESPNKAGYSGNLKTCRGAALVSGGVKECSWGCLGLADCEVICDFDAIHMNANSLPVVDIDKCVACGDCVDICPKGLFVLMPVSQKLIVQCKSLLEGDEALARCSVACNGCGRCAADSPKGVIEIKSNLAVVDYSRNNEASKTAILRCPTSAIVWLDQDKQFVPNQKSALPIGKVENQNYDEDVYYQ
ncbi:MAG: 4Fe-4S binding protein [Candidatus Competibacteraceae bacterium]|nr:4Fe-4S binding protein [Candidatus Competibacteraceae bacterium]